MRAKIETHRDVGLHALRHTFLTEAAEYADPFTLQYVAGHKNIKTTMRYALYTPTGECSRQIVRQAGVGAPGWGQERVYKKFWCIRLKSFVTSIASGSGGIGRHTILNHPPGHKLRNTSDPSLSVHFEALPLKSPKRPTQPGNREQRWHRVQKRVQLVSLHIRPAMLRWSGSQNLR